MSEILSMGNYGAYVWSSFGLTMIVLVICIVQGRSRHKSVLKDVVIRIKAMESK
jgi:heme exporter protein CcmD